MLLGAKLYFSMIRVRIYQVVIGAGVFIFFISFFLF